jgi:hypothetical protein
VIPDQNFILNHPFLIDKPQKKNQIKGGVAAKREKTKN